jgi:hypothetical protein
MENTSISFAAMAASCGVKLVEAKKCEDKAMSLREEVNKDIVKMHKAKVVVGRYSKEGTGCSIAMAFVDSLTTGGLAKKTAQNYLSLFRDAVKTGKPVKDWGGTKGGKSRKDVKGKAKTKGSKAFVDLFRPAFNHDDGKTFQILCAEIETRYQNDDLENFYDAFVDFFKAAGDDIAE